MTNYSTYWRTTFLLAVFLHLLFGLAFSFILPYITPEQKVNDIVEMDWIDVDVIEEEPVLMEEAQAVETPEPEFTLPTYEFPPIIMPEIPNEPVYVEPTPPPPIPEIVPPQPIRQPETTKIVKDEAEVLKQLEGDPSKNDIVMTHRGDQQMGQPPITISEYYPPQGSGLNYKGYVSVAATIGKNGKVIKTKVMRSSGRMMVDNIAMNAASKWTFKAALDQDGYPMECDKIITFDFKEFS